MTEPALTVDQVAELLQLSPEVVRREIRRGRLEASKPAGQLRVSPSAVDDYWERTKVRAAPAPPPISLPPRRTVGSVSPVSAKDFMHEQRGKQQA